MRRGRADDGPVDDRGEVIEIGDVRLDAARHEVRVRGEGVALPLKEFELLELLLANAGRVLTRDVLIDRVWGPNYYGDTKTLDVHVKRLRAQDRRRSCAPRTDRDRPRRRIPLREELRATRTAASAASYSALARGVPRSGDENVDVTLPSESSTKVARLAQPRASLNTP